MIMGQASYHNIMLMYMLSYEYNLIGLANEYECMHMQPVSIRA